MQYGIWSMESGICNLEFGILAFMYSTKTLVSQHFTKLHPK